MRVRAAILFAAIIGGALLASCKPRLEPVSVDDAADAAGPMVAVVNEPLRALAARLVDADVEVWLGAPPGVDPAFWQPSREDIARFQDADLILLNGAGYAAWTAMAALPRSRCVETSATFSDAFISAEERATHSHGLAGEYTHRGTAFTTWLDLAQARAQLQTARNAIVRTWPAHTIAVNERFAAVDAELASLDHRMSAAAEGLRDVPLLASHPVYQYWARRYGLDVRSVHWEPGAPLDEAAQDDLRGLLAERPATIMVWEGEPGTEAEASLVGVGVHSVVFDPCGGTPVTGDFITVMGSNVARIEALVRERSPDGE